MDFTLRTESANKFFVLFVFAVLGETAETSRAAIKSLGTFMESLLETIVNESLLEDLWV